MTNPCDTRIITLDEEITCLDVFLRIFDFSKLYPLKTQEIMVLNTRENWLRLFWNPVTMKWDANLHSRDGWENTEGKVMSHNEVLKVLDAEDGWRDYLERAKGLQYKTLDSTRIFRSNRHPNNEVKMHNPAKATTE